MAKNKKKSFKYHSRKFLNKTQGLAAIECVVESWDFGDGVDAEIKITDCSRAVNLDFSFYDVESLPQSYKKLTLLLDEIGKLHEYFTKNYEDIAQEMKEKDEKRKARLAEIKSKAVVEPHSKAKVIEELMNGE